MLLSLALLRLLIFGAFKYKWSVINKEIPIFSDIKHRGKGGKQLLLADGANAFLKYQINKKKHFQYIREINVGKKLGVISADFLEECPKATSFIDKGS